MASRGKNGSREKMKKRGKRKNKAIEKRNTTNNFPPSGCKMDFFWERE